MNQPSIACGPPIVPSSSGIVTNGPTPIIARTLTAVPPDTPSRRSRCGVDICSSLLAGEPRVERTPAGRSVLAAAGGIDEVLLRDLLEKVREFRMDRNHDV